MKFVVLFSDLLVYLLKTLLNLDGDGDNTAMDSMTTPLMMVDPSAALQSSLAAAQSAAAADDDVDLDDIDMTDGAMVPDSDPNTMDVDDEGNSDPSNSLNQANANGDSTKSQADGLLELQPYVKIALSLYKVQQSIYLLDFQRVEVCVLSAPFLIHC